MAQRKSLSSLMTLKSVGLITLAGLDRQKSHSFNFVPNPQLRRQMADEMGITHLLRLQFSGTLVATCQSDWKLSGDLMADIRQQCVVSLDPVTSQIKTKVVRNFLRDEQKLKCDHNGRIPSDDNVETLTYAINLYDIAREVVVLEAPTYPRAAKISFVGDDSVDKISQKPFAALEKLKKNLEGN